MVKKAVGVNSVMGKKRGSFNDILTVGYLLFVFALCVILAQFILGSFETKLNAMAVEDPSFAADYDPYPISQARLAVGAFDGLFIVLCIGLQIATIGAALQVRSHPHFYWIMMLFNLVSTVILVLLSNVWFAFAEGLSPTILAQFPLIQWVIHFLPLIGLGVSAVLGVAMYSRQTSGYGY